MPFQNQCAKSLLIARATITPGPYIVKPIYVTFESENHSSTYLHHPSQRQKEQGPPRVLSSNIVQALNSNYSLGMRERNKVNACRRHHELALHSTTSEIAKMKEHMRFGSLWRRTFTVFHVRLTGHSPWCTSSPSSSPHLCDRFAGR